MLAVSNANCRGRVRQQRKLPAQLATTAAVLCLACVRSRSCLPTTTSLQALLLPQRLMLAGRIFCVSVITQRMSQLYLLDIT